MKSKANAIKMQKDKSHDQKLEETRELLQEKHRDKAMVGAGVRVRVSGLQQRFIVYYGLSLQRHEAMQREEAMHDRVEPPEARSQG